MAEEAPQEEAGGSPLKKYAPLALIVLLAQGVLAWAVIRFALNIPPPEAPYEPLIPEIQAETRQTATERTRKLPFYYTSEDLKNIAANPYGTNSERFVVVSVQLGLAAYDRSKQPPEDDLTAKLGEDPVALETVDRNVHKIKSIILQTVRKKTVDQLEGDQVQEMEEEIRKRLNREVFQPLFAITEENKKQVEVQEVVVSDIIIQ